MAARGSGANHNSDLRGTWKGESESIVLGGEHPHHPSTQTNEPELRSVSFTLTIDKQDGRHFSGTFSSARRTSQVIAVISQNGTIFLADNEGHSTGTMLAPNRMELCYLHISSIVGRAGRLLRDSNQAAIIRSAGDALASPLMSSPSKSGSGTKRTFQCAEPAPIQRLLLTQSGHHECGL
jgi:hypothetical protein